ncbi:hypothetical protein SNEBB_000477 [Seison nebaliae]|nr:hypothetical protein SNEBB_000477 [Seison nebaliae]
MFRITTIFFIIASISCLNLPEKRQFSRALWVGKRMGPIVKRSFSNPGMWVGKRESIRPYVPSVDHTAFPALLKIMRDEAEQLLRQKELPEVKDFRRTLQNVWDSYAAEGGNLSRMLNRHYEFYECYFMLKNCLPDDPIFV